nr:hypothetical protein BaRGS_019305 [Batillaria attramentaria]
MDGFRWDYVNKVSGLGNFTRLRTSGVTVDYVNNTFVTKTFPCHYSIATATYYWPGSEAEIRGHRPTIWRPYDESVAFPARVDTALSWFKDNGTDFVALYFHEPDKTGHIWGPDSEQVENKVQEMDGILGLILDGLETRGLSDVVNIIVTSDHGMAKIDLTNKVTWILITFPLSMITRVVDSGLLTAILPAVGREHELVEKLKNISHVTVYRKEEIPEHFHYKDNPRVMPILVLADEGWTLSTNVTADQKSNQKGNHGYSNQLMSMHPIFFARGPNFRKGKKLTSINQVDIYPLICELLGIQAAPSNGSLDNTKEFLIESVTGSATVVKMDWLLLFLLCMFELALH